MNQLLITKSHRTSITSAQESGVTLVISLILLIVVSLLGLSAMRSTTLEEKMASNTQDQSLAFQAAEAALRSGIEKITDAETAGFTDTCDSGYCTAADGADSAGRWEDSALDVWNNASRHQQASNVASVKTQPRFIIEKLDYAAASPSPSLVVGYGGIPTTLQRYYRITARGTGASDTAVVLLQALYVQ